MKRRRAFRAVLAVAAAGLACGVAELALRFHYRRPLRPGRETWHEHDARLGWRNKRAVSVATAPPVVPHAFSVRTNALGVRRDGDVAAVASPGVSRVVALGDSFTFGFCVEGRDAWPDALERALAPRAEVLNLGVCAYGVDQMRLLVDEALATRPRLVVLAFIGDDLRRATHATYGGGEPKPLYVLGDGGALALTHVPVPRVEPGQAVPHADVESSYLAWKLGDAWTRLRGAVSRAHDPVVVRARLGRAILADAARAARAGGARFLAVYLPGAAVAEDDPYRALVRELEDAGVPACDLTAAFAERRRREPGEALFFADDPHPTPAGHAIIAAELARAVEARRLLAE